MKARLFSVTLKSLLVILATVVAGSSIALALTDWRLVPVLSGSMRPGMQPADLAVTSPLPISRVGVGQVIVYKAPIADNPTIIHRVYDISFDGTTYVVHTKGDANNAVDPWETHFAPTATVMQRHLVIPKVGRVVHYAAEVNHAYLFAIAGTLIVTLLAFARIWAPMDEPPLQGSELHASA